MHAEQYRISSVSYILFYSVMRDFFCSSCEANGKIQKLSKAILVDMNYPNNRQMTKNTFTFSSVYCCDNCGLNSDTVQSLATPLALVDCLNLD